MIVAILSAKGSPGVSVTTRALTLTWPRPVVLAEADPAGADALTGWMASRINPNEVGLANIYVAAQRGQLGPATVLEQMIDLEETRRQRLLLPGVTTSGQAALALTVWPALLEVLTNPLLADAPHDLIVDIGRVNATNVPWAIIDRADLVLVMLTAEPASVMAAGPVLTDLRQRFEDGGPPIGLVVRRRGPYGSAQIAEMLSTHLSGEMPEDSRGADLLTNSGYRMRTTRLASLQRAAQKLRESIDATVRQPVGGQL